MEKRRSISSPPKLNINVSWTLAVSWKPPKTSRYCETVFIIQAFIIHSKVTYLKPREDGRIDLDDLNNAMRKDTVLVSIMGVNNEIGVLQVRNIPYETQIIYHIQSNNSNVIIHD